MFENSTDSHVSDSGAAGRGGKDNTGRPSQTTIQSNGSILETVRNRTHVLIKFFA